MAANRRVYDSRHLQADYQEPGSAPEPYARQSSMGYLLVRRCRAVGDTCMRDSARSSLRASDSRTKTSG